MRRLFKRKKKTGEYSMLNDRYAPASLPSYGQGLETYVPAAYPMNKPEMLEALYQATEKQLEELIYTCDHHSSGAECDPLIDAQTEHNIAIHNAAVANNKTQIVRIRESRDARKKELERIIPPLEKEIERLDAETASLEGLRSQFIFHIGRFSCSWGVVITIAAMLVDAVVNFSFLQSILLSNKFLLWITVACMSVMSDGCMWALGTLISRRKEEFMPKMLFNGICIALGMAFLLSVVASVMMRFGSMDITFGTINAAGEFVGKTEYTLAEYAITLVTSFITTATGLLSFLFSVDEKAFLVSLRERKKKERRVCAAKLELMRKELALLENAPDPEGFDERRRKAAEEQIEATRMCLKLYSRKLMAIRMNDPDFTGRMARSEEELLNNTYGSDIKSKVS